VDTLVRIVTNPQNPGPTRAYGPSTPIRVPTNCGTRGTRAEKRDMNVRDAARERPDRHTGFVAL
jgi:hypothetical protein